ncbi:MAG: hypothetical protein OEM22_00035 [Acidimicrobiia bacterium]|nr:hypothetical protein [Acidimicrobiia bacterium]MDH3470720.1 hypothetical protein [Acidimicrobiia bacterium]
MDDETPEQDFPTKIADSIEMAAGKVRALTIDRVDGAAKWAALAVILFVLAIVVFVFLVIGLLRLGGEVVGTEWSYVILGGLFVLGGALVWRLRNKVPQEESE